VRTSWQIWGSLAGFSSTFVLRRNIAGNASGRQEGRITVLSAPAVFLVLFTFPGRRWFMTFRSAEDLRTLYEKKGVTTDKEIIVYCRLSHRASFTWFVLTYMLGYPRVRVYDGSWTEWGSIVGVPIEK
jgi:rhodanese-related sulfurtransferase